MAARKPAQPNLNGIFLILGSHCGSPDQVEWLDTIEGPVTAKDLQHNAEYYAEDCQSLEGIFVVQVIGKAIRNGVTYTVNPADFNG